MERMRANYKNNQYTICQFCRNDEETTEHVLVQCEALNYLRGDLKLENTSVEDIELESVKSLLKMNRRINLIRIT